MPKALIPLAIVLLFVTHAAESAQPRAERSNDDPQGNVAYNKAVEIAKKSRRPISSAESMLSIKPSWKCESQ